MTEPIRAVIFDMDGLLVDSEPAWRAAEIEVFGALGLHLTEAQCAETTGIRIDEVVRLRRAQRPWPDADEDVIARIIDRMVAEMSSNPHPKPGVRHALDFVRAKGLAVAIASSSPWRLIHAVVEALDLDIETIYSAEDEPLGKPHPGVYLETARRLGVPPLACVALEDSLPGLIAAKAARMRCVAVPEPPNDTDPRFALADVVLPTLGALDDDVWNGLDRASR